MDASEYIHTLRDHDLRDHKILVAIPIPNEKGAMDSVVGELRFTPPPSAPPLPPKSL